MRKGLGQDEITCLMKKIKTFAWFTLQRFNFAIPFQVPEIFCYDKMEL